MTVDTLLGYINFFENMVLYNFFLSLFIIELFIIFSTAFCIPTFVLSCLFCGYIFSIQIAFLLCLFGLSLGSFITFLLGKYSTNLFFKKKLPSSTNNLVKKFHKNHFIFLLLLRYTFIFPFFIENIIAASLRPTNSIFFTSTIIGISPIIFPLVKLGSTLNSPNQILSIDHNDAIFSLQNFILIICVILFSILIILAKKKLKI